MYYRVAIQVEPKALWQWKSSVLSSLDTVFQWFRHYRAFPHNRLRVFSSSSHEGMNEQIARENNGFSSHSVTAAQFLQERLICLHGLPAERSIPQVRAYPEAAAIAFATTPLLKGSSMAGSVVDTRSRSLLDMRRIEIESGAGSDHDTPYTFTLPPSSSQVLVWARLLVEVRAGALPL